MNLPILGQKLEVNMDVNVKALKFNPDKKLIAFVEKKASKLSRFFDRLETVEVVLSLIPDNENKNVKILTRMFGQDLIIERNASTFESATNAAVDAMKENITRLKEKVIAK